MEVEVHQPFPDNLKDHQFDKARIVDRLSSCREINGNIDADWAKQAECWDTAWSPNSSLFAWSCGHRKVKVIHLEDVKYSQIQTRECLAIDARQVVTSLLFINVTQTVHGRTLQRQLSEGSPGYRVLRWEDYSEVLAVGLRNGRIRIYDIESGSVLLELIDHKDEVSCLSVALNNNLTLASSSYDGTIKFWDLADDGNMTLSFYVGNYASGGGGKHKVTSVAWAPDAKRVAAVGTFKTVVIFDTVNPGICLTLCGHDNYVNSCEFSPDGGLLVTCSVDTKSIVWNSYSGAILCKLGHQFPPPCPWFPGESDTNILDCKFSKSGLQVATVADDGFLRFWDLREPSAPESICDIDSPLCCSFGPTGDMIAVGTTSGDVIMIQNVRQPLPLSHLCRLACNISPNIQYNTVDGLLIPSSLKSYLKYHSVEL